VLPESVQCVLDPGTWGQTELFAWLEREGGVSPDEMRRTFNCGVGFVLVVAADQADAVLATLREQGETGWIIGAIATRPTADAHQVRYTA
ncbi:MAG: AIR synthase-related protein, partial [Thiomonas sp.]